MATNGKIDTARLKNSIAYRADKDSVAIGTNVIYARIHQLGGMAGSRTKVPLPSSETFHMSWLTL